jgi:molybdate transport system regulatory protein
MNTGLIVNAKKSAVPKLPQLRIRVDLAPGCAIGPGKISLLEAIEREGSLSVAAQSIGMSYRRAWNLLADLNQSFSKPVVATAVGGNRGGGARVTEYGDSLIAAFRAFERDARRLAARRMRGLVPSAAANAGRKQRRRVNAPLRGR